MRVLYWVSCELDKKGFEEINKLEKNISVGFNVVQIWDSDSNFEEKIKILSSQKDYTISKYKIEFSIDEKHNSQSFLLKYSPGDGIIKSKLNSYKECFELYYGEFCDACNLPIKRNIELNFFNLPKEPKKFKDIAFSLYPLTHIWITTYKKYEKYFKDWNISKRKVTIGKSDKCSNELVQLIFPIANSPLKFGNSEFGIKMKYIEKNTIYSRDINPCYNCKQVTYMPQKLDYFPDFEKPNLYPFCETKEWFGNGPYKICTKQYLEFLISENVINWKSDLIIPVNKF